MQRLEHPIDAAANNDVATNIDAGEDTTMNPTLLSPSFAMETKPNYYGDEDAMDTGNSNDSNSTAYLEILSSEDDNPKGNIVGGETDDIIVPHVGIKFNDEKEIFEFYKNYAFHIGFSMRKRNSKKGDDGVVRYVTFTYIDVCTLPNLEMSSMNFVMEIS